MKKTLIAVKLLVALLVACTAPIQGTPPNDRPIEIPATSAPLQPSLTQPAAKPKTAPTEKATAVPTLSAGTADVPPESSVLLTMWNQRRVALRPVDPLTGWDLSGHAPISLGQSFQHAFSPDGRTLAVAPYTGGLFRILDLQAWREATTTIEVEDWISAMSFSPDGEHLAIAYDGAHSRAGGQLTLIDVARQTVTAQTSLSFIPRLLKYTRTARR